VIELGVRGPAVVGWKLGELSGRRAFPALVDRYACCDPVSPCAQVPTVPETGVPAQGAEERLLECIIGRIFPGELAEVRVDLVPVLVVEAFERRDRHGIHHVL